MRTMETALRGLNLAKVEKRQGSDSLGVFCLSAKVDGPDALDLARAAGGQSRRFMDRVTGGAERDDSLVSCDVGSAACVLSGHFGKLDTLALPFSPGSCSATAARM
jgi:hypothetical protein